MRQKPEPVPGKSGGEGDPSLARRPNTATAAFFIPNNHWEWGGEQSPFVPLLQGMEKKEKEKKENWGKALMDVWGVQSGGGDIWGTGKLF